MKLISREVYYTRDDNDNSLKFVGVNAWRRGAGGGGGLTSKFCMGMLGCSAPRTKPLPFYIPLLTKRVPLAYIENKNTASLFFPG